MKCKTLDLSLKKKWQKNFPILNLIIKDNFRIKILKFTEEFQELKKMKIE